MNRKQKVLTVIALVAFVVIGWCNYLGWPPIHLFDHDFVPFDDDKWSAERNAWERDYEERGYKEDDTLKRRFAALLDSRHGRYVWHWHPWFNGATDYTNPPIIYDLRMPWFILSVIYVGMFFLLADPKEKQR